MESQFYISVKNFLCSYSLLFTEKEGTFIFKENDFAIVLISRNSLSDNNMTCDEVGDILYLYEDRWCYSQELIGARILARLKIFTSVFARKCKVIKVENLESFFSKNHSYGNAKCKYKYALLYNGDIVAAASFSAPRPMFRSLASPFMNIPQKELHTYKDTIKVSSYEWVRYASLPHIRVVGGMGKLLKAFMADVKKDGENIEIMTYSDNEWSGGDVYSQLGFTYIGERNSVAYYVNRRTSERFSARKLISMYNNLNQEKKIEELSMLPQSFLNDFYKISNKGSKKFLIQIPPLQPHSSPYSNVK